MYIYICTYVLKKCKFLTSPHDRLLVRRVGRKFLQICGSPSPSPPPSPLEAKNMKIQEKSEEKIRGPPGDH